MHRRLQLRSRTRARSRERTRPGRTRRRTWHRAPLQVGRVLSADGRQGSRQRGGAGPPPSGAVNSQDGNRGSAARRRSRCRRRRWIGPRAQVPLGGSLRAQRPLPNAASSARRRAPEHERRPRPHRYLNVTIVIAAPQRVPAAHGSNCARRGCVARSSTADPCSEAGYGMASEPRRMSSSPHACARQDLENAPLCDCASHNTRAYPRTESRFHLPCAHHTYHDPRPRLVPDWRIGASASYTGGATPLGPDPPTRAVDVHASAARATR